MNNSHISPVNKLTYGLGSIAYGVKSNGFDYWFLIFYSQAMGVDAYLVGLALMISLVIDSLSDPVIGYFSDNTHTLGSPPSIHVRCGNTCQSFIFFYLESTS
jgi:GPH family glycoside/pentoside/hexuronide:cation symporter